MQCDVLPLENKIAMSLIGIQTENDSGMRSV